MRNKIGDRENKRRCSMQNTRSTSVVSSWILLTEFIFMMQYTLKSVLKANFEMAIAPHIAEIKYIRDKVNIF